MAKKKLQGKIVSDKMQKTVVVAVEVPKKHPIYGKTIKNTRRFLARNDNSKALAKLGDMVKIEESVRYSKKSSWKVLGVLNKEEK